MDIPIYVISEDYKLPKIKEWLTKETYYGLDIETNSLNEFAGRIITIQIATKTRCVVLNMNALSYDAVKDTLREFTKDETKIKVIHNAYFELVWLKFHLNLDFKGVYCTMLMAQLVYAGDFRLSAGLAGACNVFLGIVLSKEEQTTFKAGKTLTKEQITYGALDAWIVLPLREQININLKHRNLLEPALWECLSAPMFASIHSNGIKLDTDAWIAIARENELRVAELGKEIIEESESDRLNLNAPAQVKSMLARNGVFVSSTGVDTLKELDHPLVVKVLEHRKASKSAQSFGMNVLNFVNPITKRIHANIRQIGAKSGRLSANNPNLMQIPHGEEVRKCFIAEEGNQFVVADYSQFELRIVAEASKEPLFIHAFTNNIDLHTQTASLIFKVPIDDVKKENRDIAKRVNFGTVYGIGATSFSEKFGIEEERAEIILEEFFRIHGILNTWLRQQTPKVKSLRYTSSASGRLINLQKSVRKGDSPHNLAKNFPIQATNADVVKMVAYELSKILPNFDAKFVNVVHDEIVLEVPNKFADIVARKLTETMIRCAERYVKIVPVEVEAKITPYWAK